MEKLIITGLKHEVTKLQNLEGSIEELTFKLSKDPFLELYF